MEKDDKSLDEQIDDLVTTPHENEHVHLTGSTEMTIDGRSYRLVDNYREAFDPQKLDERYTDIRLNMTILWAIGALTSCVYMAFIVIIITLLNLTK